MIAWVWTAAGMLLLAAASASCKELAITWRMPAAVALAAASQAAWWSARRAGAEYTRHGLAWDVAAALATVIIGLTLGGEAMTWRRAAAAALGMASIAVLATDGP